jgi:hypothetical protein
MKFELNFVQERAGVFLLIHRIFQQMLAEFRKVRNWVVLGEKCCIKHGTILVLYRAITENRGGFHYFALFAYASCCSK